MENTARFLCGTYASSVLLAYWQDQIDDRILPNGLRKRERTKRSADSSAAAFVAADRFSNCTASDFFRLKSLFRRYRISYRARGTVAGSWQRVTKRILKGEPVMIGLLQLFGSSYKNHWVVVHGFMETSDGQKFYKIHDNWGKSAAVIPAEWETARYLWWHKEADRGFH